MIFLGMTNSSTVRIDNSFQNKASIKQYHKYYQNTQ